jgi:type VI secretion system secreted protein VgrG
MTAFVAVGCTAPPVEQTEDRLDQTVLGTAQRFAVLGGSTVTNTGATTVHGDLGVNPGLAVTGFPPGLVDGGTIHRGDAESLQAQDDTTLAYLELAGQAVTADLTGQDLGGLTLTAGVYHFSSSAQLTGTLTLDAQHDPAAVFIFQIGSALTTASDASVEIINGGGDCNVYWQVGSSATLGTTTDFRGNIVALTSITLVTGATMKGRALARNGAVTMDTNDISMDGCAGTTDTGADAGPIEDEADAGAVMPIDAGIPTDGATPIDGAAEAGI